MSRAMYVWFGLLEFNVSFVTVTDISRPCQLQKLIPLLPGLGFDPSFSGHNDEQSSASGQDYASDRSAIGAGTRDVCR